MSVEGRTRLRNGKIIDPTSETPIATSLMMAEANSVNTDTSENNDVSSQLVENRESYERKISDLQAEYSQLKDLMMAILKKSDNDSYNTNVQGPSKQPKFGHDIVRPPFLSSSSSLD